MRLLSSVKLLPQMRWCFLKRLYSQKSADPIRNFGILAHIDAGEYYSILSNLRLTGAMFFREDNDDGADALLLGHYLSHGRSAPRQHGHRLHGPGEG